MKYHLLIWLFGVLTIAAICIGDWFAGLGWIVAFLYSIDDAIIQHRD